jgi:hypothetical protein
MALDPTGQKAYLHCVRLLQTLAGRQYGSKLMLQAQAHLEGLAAYKQGRASLADRGRNG